jgi:CheY-like chemotaxis protein
MSQAAILCVDDEEIVLRSLKEQLRRRLGSRYLYETARSAQDAWEAIDELIEDGATILVIVSDWLMPGIRGDEFLTQVHQRHPQIVKILLTGQADDAAVERARREANLRACLAKPWSEEELVATVSEALSAVPVQP